MKNLEIFYIVIIILTLVYLLNLNICSERFSAARTNIVYSNSEKESIIDRFAKVNEEILILEQQPGQDSSIKFKFLRAPIDSHIIFYIRKEQESGQVTVNTYLMKMTEPFINIPQVMKVNNLIINDLSTIVRYYIKALNDQTYAIEKEKDDKKKAIKARFQECVNLKKTTVTPAVAVAECKNAYKSLLNF
ncbi:MAG: hypothetical protein ACRCZI_04665 [Cetobacterium sp.]